MSSIVISGDTSGAITLAAPAVSGTNTATLPAATGTVMVSGNMPAFSAYASAGQTISASTTAKVNYGTVDFDTNSSFNTSTATFTPTVAGYYQINGFALGNNASVAGGYSIYIYKNGGNWKRGTNITTGSTANVSLQVNDIIYMNGITDYVQIYVANSTGSTLTLSTGTRDLTYFSGAMVRTA
jgi:hypothetical protein